MKKTFVNKCFAALIFTLAVMGCSRPITDLREVDTFAQAKPVWAEGRETEKNLTLYFREQFSSYFASTAYVKLTASCDYRLKVNGEFVAHLLALGQQVRSIPRLDEVLILSHLQADKRQLPDGHHK